MMRKILSLFLTFSLLFSLPLLFSGCSLHAGEAPQTTVDVTPDPGEAADALDFAIRLYRTAYDGDNTLLSPLSVLAALAMTANGAAGETRSQMESVLGMTVEELNAFFTAYLAALPKDRNCKLAIADAIWIREDGRLVVKDSFLSVNADVYRAAAYRTPFDRAAVEEINGWVREKTDGMIEGILEDIPGDSLKMLILNALAFDAKWESPYRDESSVQSGDFKKENGDKVRVEFLCGTERIYLEDGDRAVGFVKPYAGGRYAFAALLPSEGTAIADYIATLDGERIATILQNERNCTVTTRLPKFESRTELILNGNLKDLGMTAAFDDAAADFSGITETCALFISKILHKTYIEVGEQGTRAAAVTGVYLDYAGDFNLEEPKVVTLDRPFVYLIYDVENSLPIFIGTLNDPS